MTKEIIKEYTNGEVTVVWKPGMCIHAATCAKKLPNVFDPKKRPWVNPEGGSTQEITDTVDKCPSGALTYFRNEEKEAAEPVVAQPVAAPPVQLKVAKGGPLIVSGEVTIIDVDGTETTRTGRFGLCRCGASAKKPYCDGAHKDLDFD